VIDYSVLLFKSQHHAGFFVAVKKYIDKVSSACLQ